MWKTAIVSVLVLVGSARADDNPWKLGPPVLVNVGGYKNIPMPVDRDVDVSDHPVVFTLHPIWQLDPKFTGMFDDKDSDGKRASEICAPTSGAILLQYLKTEHKPPFPNLLKDRKDNETSVKHMFDKMKTDRHSGTSSEQASNGLRKEIEDSGYKVSKFSFVMGVGAGMTKNQQEATIDNLRNTHDNGNPALLHVGWYTLTKKGDKWEAERAGGHFVVLAGYDSKKPNRFYITNPMIDYSKNKKGLWYSTIDFQEIDLTKNTIKSASKDHPLLPRMLMTPDIGKTYMAVVEDVIVAVPEKP